MSATNATATNLSVTGAMYLTNTTATIQTVDGGSLSITDSAGHNWVEMKDLSQNFGAAISAGAFMSRNSAIDEEFNKFRTTINADTAGTAGAGMGDGGGWGVYESASCSFSTPVDTTNGVLRLDPVTAAADGCMTMMDDSANNIRGILTATNLPVLLMKVDPSVTNANNYIYAGMGDATDGSATAGPTNFIGFVGTSTWTGLTTSGGISTTTTCAGQTISTTASALLMVEVRSTTDVHFFVDPDVSNGIQFTECGTGNQTNIPTINLAPQIQYQVRTGGALGVLDIDFYRAWQDDPANQGATTPAARLQQATTPDFVTQSGLAQYFPADDPELPVGTLVSLDADATGTRVKATTDPEDPNMVGIVTQDPGLILSNGTFDGVRVVTHGRAQAFASLENGPIHVGDALTSASGTGMVMRATKSGPMIGRALESSATGTVLLTVQPGYYLATPKASQIFQLSSASATGTVESLQSAAPTPETVLPAGSQIADAMGVQTLVVRDALFTHDVKVLGTTTFEGPVVFGTSNAGRVQVAPGQYVIDVLFEKPYPYVPRVFASPEIEDLSGGLGYDHTIWDGGYYLTNVTTTGFEIRLPRGGYCPTVSVTPCPIALSFNWFVVGIDDGSAVPASAPAASTGTTAEPVAPVPQASATSTAPEIPAQADATSTPPAPVPEPAIATSTPPAPAPDTVASTSTQ